MGLIHNHLGFDQHLACAGIQKMTYARRTDDNQTEVIKALRAIGCTVQSLSGVGEGCPDLLVGRNGINYVLEVKDGSKPPSDQSLTTKEAIWHNEWKGQKAVVASVREALAAVGAQLQ